MWQQYDARLAENTRINKEILKRMLRSKPERRLKRMKGWAIYGMVMPIPIMCIAVIPNTKFRNEWDFYLGFFLLVTMLTGVLYQTTQYFFLIRNIDFSYQVAKTKKQLVRLEKSKLKDTKWVFILLLAGMVGVCLLAQLPVMTKEFVALTIFIILFATVSHYIQLNKFKNQLNNFNTELEEIEQLEKE